MGHQDVSELLSEPIKVSSWVLLLFSYKIPFQNFSCAQQLLEDSRCLTCLVCSGTKSLDLLSFDYVRKPLKNTRFTTFFAAAAQTWCWPGSPPSSSPSSVGHASACENLHHWRKLAFVNHAKFTCLKEAFLWNQYKFAINKDISAHVPRITSWCLYARNQRVNKFTKCNKCNNNEKIFIGQESATFGNFYKGSQPEKMWK